MFCCLTRYVTEYITYLNGVWWCDQVNNTVRYVTEYITYLNGVLWCDQVNNLSLIHISEPTRPN